MLCFFPARLPLHPDSKSTLSLRGFVLSQGKNAAIAEDPFLGADELWVRLLHVHKGGLAQQVAPSESVSGRTSPGMAVAPVPNRQLPENWKKSIHSAVLRSISELPFAISATVDGFSGSRQNTSDPPVPGLSCGLGKWKPQARVGKSLYFFL